MNTTSALTSWVTGLFLLVAMPAASQDPVVTEDFLAGLELRAIGPALQSGRIADVAVDPANPDTWYVAAASGGLWKTENHGTTWSPIFDDQSVYSIGCVTVDAKNPHVVWVGTGENNSQRSVGWGDGVYKSLDGGATWRTLERGLPAGPKGRIGIAISPIDPDALYATIPGLPEEQGFFRSSNRGESWTKMSAWVPIDPQYYQELFPDPHRFDRIYAMSMLLRVSEDGGKTWEAVPGAAKHVDNHALVIDTANADHLISSTDGGLYESFDRGVTEPLGEAQTVTIRTIQAALPAADRAALAAFQDEVETLVGAAYGAWNALEDALARVADLRLALDRALFGRLDRVAEVHWFSTSTPTATHRRAFAAASAELTEVIGRLRPIIEIALPAIEAAAEAAGAPWTPGRGLPAWPP